MTPTHRIETTITEDGKLLLDHLPFQAGDLVEVIVLPRVPTGSMNSASLHGSVLHYHDPLEPVAEEDWSAIK